jgi:hypothetical protein
MDVANPPVFEEVIGNGLGVAHCDTLGVLVVSLLADNTLRVFRSPVLEDIGFVRRCTLGAGRFIFDDGYGNIGGGLAFAGPADARRLLVSDGSGGGAVHVIDVVHERHEGFVAAPGSIVGARGVAARGSMVAVCVWSSLSLQGERSIKLFEGSGATWTPARTLGCQGQLRWPSNLRFTEDDAVVVTDRGNDRVSMFRVSDGSFVRHLFTDTPYPADVEKWEDGWVLSSGWSYNGCFLHFLTGDKCFQTEVRRSASLATVRGLGLIVREHSYDGRLRVFATFDALSMAAMGTNRVQWMAAVARGLSVGK